MTNLNEKYVVYKIESVDDETAKLSDKPLEEGTYFVLRKQDILAIHALWAYVQVLHLATDLIAEPESNDIAKLADQIADFAYEWETTLDKKLPD